MSIYLPRPGYYHSMAASWPAARGFISRPAACHSSSTMTNQEYACRWEVIYWGSGNIRHWIQLKREWEDVEYLSIRYSYVGSSLLPAVDSLPTRCVGKLSEIIRGRVPRSERRWIRIIIARWEDLKGNNHHEGKYTTSKFWTWKESKEQ